jgi:hypothetical protein
MRAASFATLLLLSTSACVVDEEGVWTEALPDEAAPPPLRLQVTDLVAGQSATFRATGATPGHRIWFARSTRGTGQGPCPPVFNGMCTDILAPTAMSSAVADPSGVATWTVPLPANLNNGLDVWFQAFQYQQGAPYSSDIAHKVIGGTCADDGRENNDALGAARAVVPGALNNLRSCGGDRDWYAIQLNNGDTLDVYATFTHAEGDIDLRITDAAGTWLANAAGLVDDERAVFRATATGTYYIDVELMNDWGVTPGNDYELDLTVGAAGVCAPDPYEPNDAAGAAVTLAPGVYPGLTICSVVQDDYFQLAVVPGQTVTARIDFATANGDLDLYLYDFNGGFLDSSVGVGPSETVSWTATYATTVRVRTTLVFPDPAPTGHAYDLTLQRTP